MKRASQRLSLLPGGFSPLTAEQTARKRSESGVALVVALTATALLTVLVFDFTFSARLQWKKAAAGVKARQAALLADSGVYVAMAALQLDAAADKASGSNGGSDWLGETWAAGIPPMETGYGRFALRVEDESGRLNLNRVNLPVPRAALERLLDSQGLEGDFSGPLQDWIDKDDRVPANRDGAESSWYRSAEPPYLPRNGPLLSFAELALLKGMDADTLRALRPFASVLPLAVARVNINTAPPEVLTALHPSLDDDLVLERLLQARASAGISSWQEVLSTAGTSVAAAKSLLGFKSGWFRVRSSGAVGDTYRSVEALLNRQEGRIHIIYWLGRHGPNLGGMDAPSLGGIDDLDLPDSGRAGAL